ncbi:MAG: cytidine deaminase [Lachnospiraceae bacterium]
MENELSRDVIRDLIHHALEAREFSYSPYSEYAVGAAVRSRDGRIYTGCNVENASYPAGNCAERTAIFKAVSEGVVEFEAIAIVGGRGEIRDYAYPCGICRQTMMEFAAEDFRVIVAINEEKYKVFTLTELLPESFGRGAVE